MTKTLILIRHGHRDTSNREMDNGLSDKGREQAKAIKRFFTDRFDTSQAEKGLWLVSSPKLRCVETLMPLSKAVGRTVDTHPLLNEQQGKEPPGGIEGRVQSFLQEWTGSQAGITLLSSHGDWLPRAIYHLVGLQVEPKKGSWLELEWESGRASLKWFIPSFKHFYS